MASSVYGSSARWPFTHLEVILPVVVIGQQEHVSRVARAGLRLTLALVPVPPAMRIAGHLATLFIPQLTDVSRRRLRSGGKMLLKIGFILLIAWLLGVLGLDRNGEFVHELLMVGLMLLLMGALEARDAAAGRGRRVGTGNHGGTVHVRELPHAEILIDVIPARLTDAIRQAVSSVHLR